jgi:hypothetical protein
MNVPVLVSVPVLLLVLSAAVNGDTESAILYKKARQAYSQGDCSETIELFTTYKIKYEEKLKNERELLRGINEIIENCKKREKEMKAIVSERSKESQGPGRVKGERGGTQNRPLY